MPKSMRMLGQVLKRHRNFNEYWVCATCGRPRRKSTPKKKACKNCRGTEPPRIRITTKRGEGDVAHNDSRTSKELFAAAVYAREGLGIGTSTFPPSSPAKDLLSEVTQYEPNKKRSNWFCQVFLDSEKYAGETERDICFYGIIPEVKEFMTGKKMMQIRISADLHKWLKLHAAQNDTTMTEIIIQYLERLRQKSDKKVQVDQI